MWWSAKVIELAVGEVDVDEYLVGKFLYRTESHSIARFLNYDCIADVIHISRISEFTRNIFLLQLGGKSSRFIVQATKESRSRRIKNDTLTQNKATGWSTLQ